LTFFFRMMMVENRQISTSTTDDKKSDADKKDKKPEKSREKKSKSEGRNNKTTKKDSNHDHDKNSTEWSNNDADGFNTNCEWEVQDSSKERPSEWDPQEFYQQTDNADAWNEKHGPNRAQDLPSPTLAEASSGQGGKLSSGEEAWPFKSPRSFKEKNRHNRTSFKSNKSSPSHNIISIGSLKKEKKGIKTQSDKLSAEKTNDHDDVGINDIDKSKSQGKGKHRNSNAPNMKGSLKGITNAHYRDSRGRKEDARPLAPRRTTDRHEIDNKSTCIDKPSSEPKIRANSTKQEEDCDKTTVEDGDDKQPTKPKRRGAHRRSPENDEANSKDEDELGTGSFHTLRLDSDKPSSRSKGRRTPNSTSRNKTPSGGKPNRRRVKDKTLDCSDHPPDDKYIETDDSADDSADDSVDDRVTQEDLKDEDNVAQSSSTRSRRDRRKIQERAPSNDRESETPDSKSSNASRSGRNSSSLKRGGIRRSHSERWMRKVEGVDGEGVDDPTVIRRRAEESLNRASDGLSRSTHSRIRRHHSTNLGKMSGGLSHRSHHGGDSGRRTPSDGRRTPRRPIRHHEMVDSAGSFGDDSIGSFGECTRSQGTLESIDDFEDFGEDFYGMDLQTPGMVDFDEEMLDLMQRANPEVTEHLDRRVHRKREMVAYDQNMPMMTRQALLTRQASAQVSRQFLDGKNIDKKRLLLRNDSMSSTNSRDELKLSRHRSMRSAHGRRAPPRAKSSGLGAMGRPGYMQSIGGPTRTSEPDDRRRVFRSTSSHAGTNQYSQNKPNKVRSLSRRASSDLIQPHTVRGPPRSNDPTTRRRALQRANSATSLRRPISSEHTAPQMPERKGSKEKNRIDEDSDTDSDTDSEFGSDCESHTSSLEKPSRRPTKLASSRGKKKDIKSVDKNDMRNKKNRTKLHLLMYKTKMCVDMNVLFKHAREGETPRSPSLSLRMPSP
jgi:hypothetical protein